MTFTGIHSASDISNALMVSVERGGLVLDENEVCAEFFDLGTGLASEVLRKFTNYRSRLALVVPDTAKYGGRFNELVHEHRTHAAVRFFSTKQQAKQWLANMPIGKC